MTIYSIPSQSKIMLGELGGEAEDSKNRKARQQDVYLHTTERVGNTQLP